MALIVAQTRDRHQRISPINLTSLSEGMTKIHQVAAEMKGLLNFLLCPNRLYGMLKSLCPRFGVEMLFCLVLSTIFWVQ